MHSMIGLLCLVLTYGFRQPSQVPLVEGAALLVIEEGPRGLGVGHRELEGVDALPGRVPTRTAVIITGMQTCRYIEPMGLEGNLRWYTCTLYRLGH